MNNHHHHLKLLSSKPSPQLDQQTKSKHKYNMGNPTTGKKNYTPSSSNRKIVTHEPKPTDPSTTMGEKTTTTKTKKQA